MPEKHDPTRQSGARLPDESESVARERRLAALRELAQDQGGAAPDAPAQLAAPAAGAARAPRRRGRSMWWVALAVVVLGAGLVALVVAKRAPAGHPRAQPAVTTIVPRAERMGCVEDVVWSPDGAKVAVLGYDECSGAKPTGLINVYAAATGQLVQQLHPDDTLTRIHDLANRLAQGTSGTPAPGQIAPYIQYQAIMWSPDGTRLAVPFFVEQSFYVPRTPYLPNDGGTGTPSTPTIAGVLLSDVAGTNPHVMLAPYQQSDARLEWNLTSDQLITPALTLPPALGYRWGEQGALVPQTPLGGANAPTTAPIGPIGAPSGGQTFTVWQPGQAVPGMTRGSTGLAAVPNLYVWFSSFGAWSPDGQYLVTPAYAVGQVSVAGHPAADAQAAAAAGFARTPTLPARDAALSQLYSAMVPDANREPPSGQFVAWRPDGRVLAATEEPLFSESRATFVDANTTVVLYDTGSGREVGTLTARSHLASALTSARSTQYVWLSWSPDGKQLLLLDDAIGTLTIWGPGNLPR